MSTSVIEYVDSYGTVHGTASINWDTQALAFPMTAALPVGTFGSPYSGTITTQASNLSSASVYRGHFPAGLSLSASGSTVTVSGTPTEAGVFDLWLQATTSDGKSSFIYSRLGIVYANSGAGSALIIVTGSLPNFVVNVAYSQTLLGFGGTPAYTWSSNLSTAFPALATYITLDPSTGILSGTVTDATLEGQSASVTFTLTDSLGNAASKAFTLTVNSSVIITTTAIPAIASGVAYSFALQASGGTPPYTWTTTAGTLPTSITLSSAGVLAGTTADSGYGSQSVTFQATDSASHTGIKTLTVTVGVASGMTINTDDVGYMHRGANANNTMTVEGTYTLPITWVVASSSPNPLPPDLSLIPNASNQGQTASLYGAWVGATGSGYMVEFQANDSAGHVATALVDFTIDTNLVITTTSPLPNAPAGLTYNQQLNATGGGSSSIGSPVVLTWSATNVPPGFPFSLGSSGLLVGTPTPASTGPWTFTANVADSIVPPDTASQNFTVTVTSSSLAITTGFLPGTVAGVAYNEALAATGGVTPYTWGITAGSLPSGLSLGSNGVISGTTSSVGSYTFTVQVTDSASATAQQQYTLSVTTGLALMTGIDYTDGLSTNSLGYIASGSTDSVDSISPRPSRAFYLVAQGLIASTASQISVVAPSGFSAIVESVSSGTAFIRLSGPYSSGSQGNNSQLWTVTDKGNPSSPVQASISPTWTVYTSGALRTPPSSGSIPSYGVPLYEGTAGSLPIYNDPSSPVFNFQAYNGAAVDKAAALAAAFSLAGSNSASSGIVSLGFDGTNYNISYSGGAFASGVASTVLTITADDIAWYNGVNKSFDTYATGQSLALPFLYLLKTTVGSVTPTTVTIAPSSTAPGSTYSSSPGTESQAITTSSGNSGWGSIGNLKNGAPDTLVLYGTPGGTGNVGYTLSLTGWSGINAPGNSTITSVTAAVKFTASNAVSLDGVGLLGVSPAPPTQSFGPSVGGTFTATFTGLSLTPAQANSGNLGCSFYFRSVPALGTVSVSLASVTLTVNYTTATNNSIVVSLARPLSPYQIGTSGGTGNTISAIATMVNATVISTVPNYGTGALAGWLTGWTVTVQFASGSGTLTCPLTMNVTGSITYLSGGSIVTSSVVYLNAVVATITAIRGA
jgi:hypothetical protein